MVAPLGEVLFEFRRIGNAVKVTAVHVATDTEVCLIGPSSAGQHALKTAAISKLTYVLAKRAVTSGAVEA
jgi:hypothetical protein